MNLKNDLEQILKALVKLRSLAKKIWPFWQTRGSHYRRR